MPKQWIKKLLSGEESSDASSGVYLSYIPGPSAFTLVEVMAVLGIVAVLLSVIVPAASKARGHGRTVVCKSNLHQLALANLAYSQDAANLLVPGAADFLRNLDRWHGRRKTVADAFEAKDGPLMPYLGNDGEVRQCPAFAVLDLDSSSKGFERGAGGFGYNNRFLGRRTVESNEGAQLVTDDRLGVALHQIRRPGETIMFADAAFAAKGLIEYSFVEPRFHPEWPQFRTDPSIHFRHAARANVAWCDGHVNDNVRTFTWSSGTYPGKPERFAIGWFGESDDNRLFDLR